MQGRSSEIDIEVGVLEQGWLGVKERKSEMVQRCTRPVAFRDSLRFYKAPSV